MHRLLSILAVMLAGCAGSTQEQPTSTVTTTSAVVLPNRARVAAIEQTPITPRGAPDTFTDDQVLGLVAAFNTNAIDLAKVGYERASDERVKRLAKLLVSEHTEARDQEARVSERLALRVAPTDRMQTMQADGAHEIMQLGGLVGHAFDVAWLKAELELQRDGLALVDIQLIPSARIPDMQAHLADLRDHLDHHLRDVSDLQRAD